MVYEDQSQEGDDKQDYFYDSFDLDTMSAVQVLTQDVLVACIMLGLTALVGLLGNILMVRALLKYIHLRISFFIVMGSTAVADMLCLVISVPMHILHLTLSPVTESWCKASKYLDAGSSFAVAYHLVLAAVLRGILLTSRGRNPPTPLQTLICVVVVWIIALLGAIPFIYTITVQGGFCMPSDTDLTDGTDGIETDLWMLHAFSSFIPMFIIIVVYVFTHFMGKRYFEDSYSYKEKQLSRLVSVIVVVFMLCQIPYRALDLHIYYREVEVVKLKVGDEQTMESLVIARNYLLCFLMADKALRPVIYSKLAPQLAEAFDEVINCTMCGRVYTGQARVRTTSGGDPADDSLASSPQTTITTASSSSNSNSNSNGQVQVHRAQKSKKAPHRHPSTSSNAPLTGGSDGESMDDHVLPPGVEEVDEREEELQVIVTQHPESEEL